MATFNDQLKEIERFLLEWKEEMNFQFKELRECLRPRPIDLETDSQGANSAGPRVLDAPIEVDRISGAALADGDTVRILASPDLDANSMHQKVEPNLVEAKIDSGGLVENPAQDDIPLDSTQEIVPSKISQVGDGLYLDAHNLLEEMPMGDGSAKLQEMGDFEPLKLREMEMQAEIVIVGAGIAGLATAVGLHRLGLRALVLEASNDLRVTGFAFTSWSNAWKALDALGIGDMLREKRPRQQTLTVISAIYGITTSQFPLISTNTCKGERDYETRCLERKMLVQTLANELPKGSIKFSSKVVSIEESIQHKKLLHLVDGSIIETKVLIGCDGINSVVGRWLGLKKPQPVGQSTIRGHVRTPIERRMIQFIGDGVKYGIAPIDDNSLYWFLTFIPSTCDDKEVEESPVKMKEFVLSKLGKASEKVRELVEKTDVNDIICSPIKFRLPWEALWGEITRDNVCVAGDAFHPMTPDLGQGACSSLEDGVILARCLGRAMQLARQDDDPEKEYKTIKMGLDNYAKQRRWRAFALTTIAYLVGYIELASSKSLQFLRDYVLARYLNRVTLKMTNYDCGCLI